jgi:hypothetical protein
MVRAGRPLRSAIDPRRAQRSRRQGRAERMIGTVVLPIRTSAPCDLPRPHAACYDEPIWNLRGR